MTHRAYLATDLEGLRALHIDGVLPAAAYDAFVATSEDEEAEYDAMQAAADEAFLQHGARLVVAADVELTSAGSAGAVPLDSVASFHVGEDLAWYATQELVTLL